MKKILLLICAVLAILFTGCKQLTRSNTANQKGNAGEQPNTGSVKTTLKITNQSSRHIVDVNYDGTNFNTGEFKTVKCLPIGQSAVKTLSEDSNSYIRFTVYSKEYNEESGWIGTKYEVRTNELVTVEKEKTKLITITDNTLVVLKGSAISVTLAKLYDDATTVSIKNETSRMLKKVTFNEKIFSQEKGEFNKGASVIQSFTEACEGYVYFTLHARDHYTSNEKDDTDHEDNYDCAVYNVRTKEKFSVKKYESQEIIIGDATEVVKIGETDEDSVTVSKLLKNNTLVKIENAATRPLIEVKYGVKNFTIAKSEYNNYLPINKYAENSFDTGDISEYVVFTLPRFSFAGTTGVTVRTAEKLFVRKGTAKEIRITDKTMVVKEGENEPVVLSSLFYNITKLTIVNNSSRALYTTTEAEEPLCAIGASTQKTVGDYGASWKTNIVFKLYARSSNTGTSYKVRTHELFELTADVPKSITVDDSTLVVVEGTTEAVTIASLLDNRPAGKLTIQNNTSRALSSGKFGKLSNFNIGIGQNTVLACEEDTTDFVSVEMYAIQEDGKPYDASIGVVCYTFKIDEKMSVAVGEEKTLTITDSTSVRVKDKSFAVPISSLLDSTEYGYLIIQNNTYKTLYNLHWAGCLYKGMEPYSSLVVRIGSAGVDDYIHYGYAYSWRTTERVTANVGETKTFTITDTTQVVEE